MGFGTSAPELAVSILASFRGEAEVAVGNVIGSNIANVGLVLGLTALIAPLTIAPRRFKSETPPLLIATLLILFLAWDFNLSRWEGALLLLGLAIYTWRTLRKDDDSDFELEDEFNLFAGKGIGYQILLALAGLTLLVLGAEWMVRGAVSIARGVESASGLSGFPSSPWEPVCRKLFLHFCPPGEATGKWPLEIFSEAIIFNIFMVLGASATLHPLNIQEKIHPDLLITTGVTCLLLLLISRKHQLRKPEGIILLLCYFSYIGLKAIGTI